MAPRNAASAVASAARQRARRDQNPRKHRFAKRLLWRREKLWGNPIGLVALALAIPGALSALVNVGN
jgi:hypothetical protein